VKFIYADSLDVVDPNYNFIEDEFRAGRKPYWDDVYAHEILPKPPYDGLLVSRSTLGSGPIAGKYTQAQAMRFFREGGRTFLRMNEPKYKEMVLMGDCGAFNYHRESSPPYTPSEIVDFYECGGFNYGCSIDHIIFQFGKDEEGSEDSKNRFEITLDIAGKFFEEHRSQRASFEPMGVVQGWSPESMRCAARRLLKMGYRYIAIGGLVPLGIPAIRQAVVAVHEEVSKFQGARIHLLGFAKAECINEFQKYSVASFDSTSPLLRAFKDKTKNYWLLDQDNSFKYYSAIRVPQSSDNNTLRNRVKCGAVSLSELVSAEKRALESLRAYDREKGGLDETLGAVLAYSRYLLDGGKFSEERVEKELVWQRQEYQRTLQDRSWQKCGCEICEDCSIEVVIFRASNRNKRRGMHNLCMFHQHVTSLLEN